MIIRKINVKPITRKNAAILHFWQWNTDMFVWGKDVDELTHLCYSYDISLSISCQGRKQRKCVEIALYPVLS